MFISNANQTRVFGFTPSAPKLRSLLIKLSLISVDSVVRRDITN